MNDVSPFGLNARAAAAPGDAASRVLLIDADRAVRGTIADFLGGHGFAVFEADGAADARTLLADVPPDLVVMDVAPGGALLGADPQHDGLALCRDLAVRHGLPVIVLSAMAQEIDRIIGLEAGADDYLAKPASPRELLARIRAVRRRMARADRAEVEGGSLFTFAGWHMDVERRSLFDPVGAWVGVSDGEFALLRAFVQRPRRVLTRDQLLEYARGPGSDAFDRAIDTQVSRLRRKLGRQAGEPLIRTIRGEGYMFTPRVDRP